MAEVEVGGVKFTGGKMFAVLMALSSAVGALWGGFEIYSRYLDMEEKISQYEAPDLSGIEQQLAVLNESIDAYELKFSTQKEILDRVNADLSLLMNDVRDSNRRLYTLETETQREMLDIRKSITEQIEEALANPLAGK